MEAVLTDLDQKIAIPHTAVVVIDMQNDFCSEEGALAKNGRDMTAIRSLVPRLQQFLDRARRKNVTIVFVATARGEEEVPPPMKELWIRHSLKNPICVKGSWGAEFIPEIQPKSNETVLIKTRYSAFMNTDLDTRLCDLGIATLIVTGVATNVCVETTCRDGFMRGYYIVVASDLAGCTDQKLHDCTLFNIDRYFGTVTSSAEILRIWGGNPTGRR